MEEELSQREKGILLAWVISTEGTITLHPVTSNRESRTKHISPKIVVGNTNLVLLEELRRLFGGTIISNGHTPLGHRPVYRWGIFSQSRVLELLRLVRPFLPTKREQCDLLIEYLSNHRRYSRQGLTEREVEIRNRVHGLNARGSDGRRIKTTLG